MGPSATTMRALAIAGVLSVLASSMVDPTPATAQVLDGQAAVLRGLQHLRVESVLAGVADRIGLNRTDIAEAVEGQLRGAGLQVLAPDDRSVRGDPKLMVTVHTIAVSGGYAFMVSVQFIERGVSLRRYVELMLAGELPDTPTASVEPLRLVPGVVWQLRGMGTTSAARARRFLAGSVDEYVGRFVTDYQAANAR